MRVGKSVFFILLGFLISSVYLSSQVPTGQLYGTVTDEQGNPLPGVAVEATSPKLVGKAASVTATNGVYRLFSLSPGTYKITYTLQGFKTITRDGIIVGVEQAVKLDIRMELGALEEKVTVVGRSPLIDVKNTTREMTLAKETFELLPRGRNFDTLVTTVPGVSNEVLLAGISVDGASGAENMFHIDGTDITDLYYGVNGQKTVVFEFVDEVQIKAGGYTAEFGGSLGGVVNVITRQGGNVFHGDVTAYYSGSMLTGKERDSLRLGLYDVSVAEYVNYQDIYGKDEVHRIEAGFSLGGYIVKDRLWFFGSFLPIYQPTQRHVTFESSGTSGDFTRKDQWTNFQLKLTAQPFSFLRLGASFVNNFSKFKGDLPPRDGTGDPTSPWPDFGWSFPNWSAAIHTDLTLGNNALLSLRAGSFYSNNWTKQIVQPTEPHWYHQGLGNSIYPDIPSSYVRPYGWTNMSWDALYNTEKEKAQRSSVGADFSYFLNFAGEHALKLGLQWKRTAEDWKSTFKFPCIFLEWGLPAIAFGVDYGIGTYGHYWVLANDATGPFGYQYKVHSDRWAFYLQDSWTIKNRLTLNLGLRAENEYVPSYSDDPEIKDKKPINFPFREKLAPRLGVIYDVFGDSSLKVFGSYGLYYDVMKLYAASQVFGGMKAKCAYYTLDTYEWDKIGKNGYFPGSLLTVVDIRPVELNQVDPGVKPMSQREITFGVEKRLKENFSASLRVVQKHLRYAFEDVGIAGLGMIGGDAAYYFTNPGYGYSLPTTEGGLFDPKYPKTPKAKREYWALNIGLDKRLSNNWLAGFSYTWSRLTGNYSGLAASDEGGRNSPNFERSFDYWFLSYDKNQNPVDGPLATDRTHFFKFYGAYNFPFRLTVGAVVNAMSGIPVTETWVVWSSYFMPFNRGNLGRTPFLWFTNLYAEYNWKIGKNMLNININIDNVFNVRTSTVYYSLRTLANLDVSDEQLLARNWDLETSGFVPDPRFNKASTFYPPIAGRLGVRYSF